MLNEIYTLVEDEIRNEIFQKFIDQAVGGETIVEVGVFVGGNLCRVAKMIEQSEKYIKLYGIDNFSFENISSTAFNNAELNNNQNDFYNCLITNIQKCDINIDIEIINADSIEASKFFNDNNIDLLFLDGNHLYEYCIKEIPAWFPKVKSNGFLVGHDWSCDGVQRAVKECLPSYTYDIISDAYLIKK